MRRIGRENNGSPNASPTHPLSYWQVLSTFQLQKTFQIQHSPQGIRHMWTTRQERLYSPKIILEFVCQENASECFAARRFRKPNGSKVIPSHASKHNCQFLPPPPHCHKLVCTAGVDSMRWNDISCHQQGSGLLFQFIW